MGNQSQLEQFIASIKAGNSLEESLNRIEVDDTVRTFLQFTFSVIASRQPHRIAAAFTFGREDLIPDMFTALGKNLDKKVSADLSLLTYYLERHSFLSFPNVENFREAI